VRRDLAELPAMLDRVDRWIEEGVIGQEEPNAADFQIAPSVRLLMTMEDLRRAIERRPAGELARRLVPEYPSRVGAGTLPTI
jgi:glutathione S-transferase